MLTTNRDFAPVRITFAHGRNSRLREVHRLLRCPVQFAQSADSWVLPQSVMEYPILSEDGQLLQILETHADDLLAKRRSFRFVRNNISLTRFRYLGIRSQGVEKAYSELGSFALSCG